MTETIRYNLNVKRNMRTLFTLFVLSVLVISCNKKEEESDVYYIRFQLKDGSADKNLISIKQESPTEISGNGIKDSDFVSVGFGIKGIFKSPSKSDITQMWFFYFSQSIPKEEFNINSGVYDFKNPSNFKNYIPSGNFFENNTGSLFTYFHEDDMTFCTAALDVTYNNVFRISESRYYVDSDGNDAVDIAGTFAIRFSSMCNNGDIEVTEGKFRSKVLINEIS